MHKPRVEHLEEAQLLEHPVKHGLISFLGCHLFDGSCDFQKVVQLCERLAMQCVDVDVGNFLEDHLLEPKLLCSLRGHCFDGTAADTNV